MTASTLHPISPPGAIARQILVVDADPAAALSTKSLLETHGYSVTVANDDHQVQSCLATLKPDLVILDAIVNGETGFEICTRIKQREKELPVLFLMDSDLEESRDLALRAGGDGLLTKPVDTDLLLNSIQAIAQVAWQKTHGIQAPAEHIVRFQCRCSKTFNVSVIHQGRTMTCPSCGEVLPVPRPD